LLLGGRSGIAGSATLEDSTVNDPVRVEEGAVVRNSVLGPNVTVEAGARVEDSTVADTILGSGSTVAGSTLHDSLVGSESRVTAYRGRLSVGDHSEVDGEG
jgi:glucose-1-phosphate thymidylyltransferase